MTNCTQESFEFPVCKRRRAEVNFKGGDITSNGGVLLLQQADRRAGLTEAIARTLDDPRRKASVDHDSLSLLRQRVYALALGYEDLNDHDALRLDLAVQTALGRSGELASSPTLCRWENRADRETAVRSADRPHLRAPCGSPAPSSDAPSGPRREASIARAPHVSAPRRSPHR